MPNVLDTRITDVHKSHTFEKTGVDIAYIYGAFSVTFGAIKARSGAVTGNNTNNCGFVFGGDNDSGMFSSADGDLHWGVNGVKVAESTQTAYKFNVVTRFKNSTSGTPSISSEDDTNTGVNFPVGNTNAIEIVVGANVIATPKFVQTNSLVMDWSANCGHKNFNSKLVEVAGDYARTVFSNNLEISAEMHSPEQHGGFYGQVYRIYFWEVTDLTPLTGVINKLVGSMLSVKNYSQSVDEIITSASYSTNNTAKIVKKHGDNYLMAMQGSGYKILNGWADYTK